MSTPTLIRQQLGDTIEEIGQAMALLRESADDLQRGNIQAAKLVASDALELLSGLESTFSALAAATAIFSEN